MPAIVVQGAAELIAAYKSMPAKLQRQVVRKALRPAGKVLLAATKAATPVYSGPPNARIIPGQLRNSLKLRVSKFNRKGRYSMIVMPGTREALGIDPKDKHYWPAALEFGHGNVAPRSYLRATFDRMEAPLGEQILQAVGDLIEQAFVENGGS